MWTARWYHIGICAGLLVRVQMLKWLGIRILIVGCLSGLGATAAGAAPSDKPLVLASIRPLALIAEDLVGDLFAVDVLLGPGADPHNATLRYSQRKQLGEASVLLWLGPDFERFLAKSATQIPAEQQVRLESLQGVDWVGGHAHSSHSHGHDSHSNQALQQDMHLWLNPQNAQVMARALAALLSEQYPSQKAALASRLKGVLEDWQALDRELTARFASLKSTPFGVYHNAYAHFVAHYQLNMVAAINQFPEQGLSAQHLAKFIAAMQDAQCLVAESRGQSAERLAKRLDVPLVVADPLANTPVITSYRAFMEDIANSFERCLQAPSIPLKG